MIGTLRPNTAHLPCNFSAIESRASRWIRGYSETVHCGSSNITFWNDSNSASFLDNDLISSRDTGEQIESQSGQDKLITFAPHTAAIYNQNYGHIDRSNQAGSYYKMDRKTVRKQNRVLFDAIETYGLINQHAVLVNSPTLVVNKSKHDISAREFRFDVVRVWLAKCRIAIGTTSIHYPFRAATNTQGVTSIIHSPRKGTHKPVKINMERPKKQLRCRECSAHTSFKCSKCGNLERPVPLCRLITGRNCWDTFHQRRIFDLPSSQSTGLSSQGDSQN